MDTENIPYSFVKKIDQALYKKEEIPFIKGFYPLNIDDLAKHLEKALSVEGLSLSITNQRLLSSEEAESGFTKNSSTYPILLSPLSNPALLLIDKEDVKKLLNLSFPQTKLQTQTLEDSFFTFTLLNTLSYLEEVGFLKDLSPKITKPTATKEGYCLDIILKIRSFSIPVRLCLSDSFRKQWNTHFVTIAPYEMPTRLQDNTEIFLSFAVGNTSIQAQEIKDLKKGDFLALENVFYDPRTSKGSFRVMLNNNCILRAKLTETTVKLLEYVSLEEEPPMSNEENPREEIVKQPTDKPQSIDNVPLTITVEVAKIALPLSELKQLQPGNTLPLSINPEEGVVLTVNNKVIGKGELVYLGEKLGVRILDWGKEKKTN